MRWQTDLVKDIRFHDGFDDSDSNADNRIQRDKPYSGNGVEFTDCNRENLVLEFLKVKDQCKVIVEIGVHRNGDQSSTWCFLNNKNPDTVYVGIDLDDKKFLENKGQNIHTIQGDSGHVEQHLETLKNLGIEQIDFLFIDGWHSINQVLKDWEYTKILSPHGIVGFHDTSAHPGPYLFIKALDTAKWDVTENCCPEDHGIGFARQK